MINDAAQILMKGFILDIGYKSILGKPTCDKKILKTRRLLRSKFFHFESGPWH